MTLTLYSVTVYIGVRSGEPTLPLWPWLSEYSIFGVEPTPVQMPPGNRMP